MSGETERQPSGWTVDTLKDLMDERYEHIAQRFIERDLRFDQRFTASQDALASALETAKEAVQKAETATEKRFDSVNEFRQTLADQTAGFMTRVEVEARLNALTDKVDANAKRLESSEGRGSGIQATVAVVLAIAAIAATLAGTVVYLIIHRP